MLSPQVNRKVVRKGCGGQNIKVFTRCRPINNIEKTARAHGIIDCPTSRDITVKERLHSSKTFSFDRVFGPDSKQIDVYKAVAKPLVEEVTNGFNCTIFAYGQTGTGKTFTMEGERSNEIMNWDEDPQAGIIPRCVNHLFDELRIQKVEFTMRVSFLELYNEEIFDLLSAHDDMSKLRLYEDGSRKGSCIIQSLEEVLVRSKSDVYNVIAKGSAKRQTAATLMNAHSSRSHTVFTVTVHIKENTIDGDELLKTGKLHLVDLAGSENIGRSGAVDKRAREAGNINQSLLTLGRVITSLVEKAPHIPYRESKLTRLLQDALGGRTKTSIIATVSPASVNLEETLSTLDYAHRAKNIQNKPEVNQKLNKKELIGEYSVEIDRLRRDLMAMREKNGVYLANDNYEEMVNTIEQQTQEISEKISQIRQLEEELEQKIELFTETTMQLDKTTAELSKTETKLSDTKEILSSTQKLLSQTATDRDEQKYLLQAHMKTETKLHEEGRNLINTADVTTSDINKLQDKLDRKRNVEQVNIELTGQFQEDFTNSSNRMRESIHNFNEGKNASLAEISTNLTSTANNCTNKMMEFNNQMTEVSEMATNVLESWSAMQQNEVESLNKNNSDFVSKTVCDYKEQRDNFKSFEMKQILPAIQLLASLISKQSQPMTAIQAVLPESVEHITQLCADYCQKQNEDTENIEKELNLMKMKVKEYSDYKRNAINDLKERVDKSLEENRKTIMSVVEESRKMITGFVDETIQEIEAKDKENYDNIEKAMSCVLLKTCSVRDRGQSYSSDINKIQEANKVSVDENVCSLENGLRELGEQRCTIETSITALSAELSSVYESNIQSIDEYGESVREGIKKRRQQCLRANETEKDKLNKLIDRSKSEVASACEQWSTEIVQEVDSVNTVKKDTDIILLSAMKDIEARNREVEILFAEEIVQDKPTGATPARRDYTYRRSLPATSPHERILGRIRHSKAFNTPLSTFNDVEEDSSIHSNSSSCDPFSPTDLDDNYESISLTDLRNRLPLSRSGSGSDKDEGVFLLPSVPQSRNTSDEFKPVSISRSSSSSSLNDSKENKQLQRKGSFNKKRELKQPTVYTNEKPRKVLGNLN